MRFSPSVFLVAAHLALSVHCLHNITIDDDDSSIQYTGNWGQSTPTNLDYGGSHALTTDLNSSAVFNFTGIAVYFMSPLWPYDVSTTLTLDSRPTVIVDLTDHNSPNAGGGIETVQSSVVWSAENLPNTMHTLRVSVGRGQQFAIVDGIIYTVLDPGESSPSESSSDSSDGHQVIIIVLATLLGILALLLFALVLWICLRRRDPNTPAQRRGSAHSSSKWSSNQRGDDAQSFTEHGALSSPRSTAGPQTAPYTPPAPSRPESGYNPRETAWSTSSVGGAGVPNMTGVGVSARNSRIQGDNGHSTSHFGASQGDLADAYDTGPYTNPNRDPRYPNI